MQSEARLSAVVADGGRQFHQPELFSSSLGCSEQTSVPPPVGAAAQPSPHSSRAGPQTSQFGSHFPHQPSAIPASFSVAQARCGGLQWKAVGVELEGEGEGLVAGKEEWVQYTLELTAVEIFSTLNDCLHNTTHKH